MRNSHCILTIIATHNATGGNLCDREGADRGDGSENSEGDGELHLQCEASERPRGDRASLTVEELVDER